MATDFTYTPPSSADFKAMLTSPQTAAVVDGAASAGIPYAVSISPEDTGEYKGAFRVETSVVGDRVEARLFNIAAHSVIVEGGTPTQPGHNVLAQTADWIEAGG